MTKDEFKSCWEANEDGSGITFDDIAECFIKWGLGSSPETQLITRVRYVVLKAANTKDAEEYHPSLYNTEYN